MNKSLKAEQHLKFINENYSVAIQNSINKSEVIRGEYKSNPKIELKPYTVSKAVEEFANDDTCVLNFASYTRPGGGFITGSMAQEEAICHDSTLYPILKHFEEEYNKNYTRLRSGEVSTYYDNFAIYSPGVFFTLDSGNYGVSVITCAAPNLRNITYASSKAKDVMFERIKFILDIAQQKNQKVLILGAFGCGVFKNNPIVVAEIFKELIPYYNFEHIIFAIPGGENYDAFKKVFNI